jgi:hypothetical protein
MQWAAGRLEASKSAKQELILHTHTTLRIA